MELNGRAGLPWLVFFLDDRKEVTVVYFVDLARLGLNFFYYSLHKLD